jgi:hypothetical protein
MLITGVLRNIGLIQKFSFDDLAFPCNVIVLLVDTKFTLFHVLHSYRLTV